jgi:hypothetical protein
MAILAAFTVLQKRAGGIWRAMHMLEAQNTPACDAHRFPSSVESLGTLKECLFSEIGQDGSSTTLMNTENVYVATK